MHHPLASLDVDGFVGEALDVAAAVVLAAAAPDEGIEQGTLDLLLAGAGADIHPHRVDPVPGFPVALNFPGTEQGIATHRPPFVSTRPTRNILVGQTKLKSELRSAPGRRFGFQGHHVLHQKK